MTNHTPESFLDAFFAAFNLGDRDALLGMYEPHGALVAGPGAIAQGSDAVRAALDGFLALRPTMNGHASSIVVAGDVALALTRWTLDGVGPDGAAVHMQGEATDVLRRQADGSWRVVIDNPWGVGLLPSRST
jgi:uncharacterized protein (TIGR02246 family)